VIAVEDTINGWFDIEETLQQEETNILMIKRVLPRMEEVTDQKEPVQN
jgi:hypothetical protein